MALPRFVDPHRDPAAAHAAVPAVDPRPLPRDLAPLVGEVHGDGRTLALADWVVDTHASSLLALVDGVVVHEWYAADGLPGEPVPVGADSLLLGASMTKSALAHLVGTAVGDGLLALDDRVVDHVPELRGTGWHDCTVDHVMTMTSGAAWREDHRDPDGPAARLVGCFTGGGDSRSQLREVEPRDAPGTRWEYSTADSQVLDWVRERATGAAYDVALARLWSTLGCVRDAAVSTDAQGVAMAGGGLAACAEDWLRLVALQLDGTTRPLGGDDRVLPDGWVEATSAPAYPFTTPGRLPSSITSHAGFGRHWWPTSTDGRRVVADGARGQLGHVDRDLGTAVLKTSLWPFDDAWVDRAQRDLTYLGLPAVAASAHQQHQDQHHEQHHREETP